MASNKQNASPVRNYLDYVVLFIILLFTSIVRVRLMPVPLERDEGEFAYFAQLILRGIPPFVHAYTMKLPGVSVLYALFMLAFGQSASAIHLGLLIVNALTTVMVYLIAKSLFDRVAALSAAAVFAVLSLGPGVLGVFAHATNFVIFFALAGYLVLFKAVKSRRMSIYLWSGLLFGLAFLMKQHGVFFAIFAPLYLLWVEREKLFREFRRTAGSVILFLIGMIVPFALFSLVMLMCGAFDKYWFWTFKYAREYVSSVSPGMGLEIFLSQAYSVTRQSFLLWALAGAGTIFLFVDLTPKKARQFSGGFAVFSFLAICPGFYFREHYFVLLLPAAALLSGIAVSSTRNLLVRRNATAFSKVIPVLIVIAVICHSVYEEREFFFIAEPAEASRMLYGLNPFPEAYTIAKYIKERTSTDDYIAVLGSEPEIYFYADRISATGHIYMYGLMENQKYSLLMQQELAREIETNKPKFIVVVNVSTTWLARPDSQTMIFDWARNYIAKNYELDGIADIFQDGTVYRWGDDARRYPPGSEFNCTIFKRKT